MRLNRIRLKNFLPFGGQSEHEIAFPKQDGRSLVIVWGRNEHGKTTLLNAVRWALYGYAIGRHRKRYELAKMVNRDAAASGDWTMRVVLDFEHAGKTYVLSRSAEKRELITRPKVDNDFSVNLMMTENGHALAADRMNQLLGRMMPEAISRFHLFDGELLQEYEELVGAETSQVREIRTAIEDILGTPALLLGRDEVRALLKGARKKQAEAMKQADASDDAAQRLIETQEKGEAAIEDRDAIDQQMNDIEDEIEEIGDFLEKRAKDLGRQDDIDSLKDRLEKLTDDSELIRLEKAGRLQTLWRDLLADCVADRVRVLQESVTSREERFIHLGALRERLAAVVHLRDSGDCPTCGGSDGAPAGEAHITELGASIASIETSLESGESDLPRLATLAKVQPTGDREAIEMLEKKSAMVTVTMQRIRGELDDLKASVIEDSGREAQEKRRRESELNKLLGSLSERRREVVERIEELQAVEEELSKIMSRSSSVEARRANLTAEVLTELHDLFRRAIDEHRNRLLSEVESEASKRFMTLTATPQYQGLKINDNYGLSIIDHQDRPVDLRSSGAEQVVALSLIQALGSLSVSDAPLMIDTPFGRLDLEHRRNILEELPDFGKQVILLAHEGELDPNLALEAAGHSIAAEFVIERETPTQSVINRRERI